ncbi:hypothetical protein JG687_00008655 [Phytophthora cactorum]|uniref:Uncharacterized protein n=3 Tax=Phytophthora cactorum TaxID=29920 RepID=A0A8T1UBT3_9STRA|nr:hypothetical protein JG687_00008655 [Phytophthora cactorum]
MQADRDAALSWRETFDELLVFEQDFDTAMQILMFQDEKVARLSLEDSQHTRSQRTRSRQEASIRDATPRPEPPPFPTPQTQEEPFTPSTTQSDGHSKQLSSGTKAGSAGDRAGSSVDVLGVGRGDGTGTGLVASLFSTGSGKRVSISKAKLDAYEKQMCDDDSDVLAPSSARTDGHSKQLSSGTKAGSAGDRAGSSVDVLGVGRGDGTGTGLVASLFSTGSGKQVSISKAKLDTYEKQILFSTGSGKQVSISKAKLDTYEKQMCDDDSDVLAPSSARTDGHSKQLSSGTKAGSAGDRAGSSVDVLGVGRGDGTGTGLVASLFSTGSGKRVSISKAKLDAYEKQMCDDDSDVLAPLITLTEGDALKLGAERMAMSKKRSDEYLRQRENGFNLSGVHQDRLPQYNALLDRNLRHHFESRPLQSHLNELGLIDQRGRIVDLDKQKSKLFIIDQEFKLAEEAERKKQREEEELRRRVQMKRHDALHDARQREKLQQLKEEKKIAREIIQASKGYSSASKLPKSR